ncbi:NAD(P)-dependent oxidoreductase [Saccharothrix australiensis]|uniref:3-hydroxyisobutyrate dehydrogenase-like beta-hydroxyacid dehydrogenase n=1 Tax=Saccharothrix australiensis TaxID=2072 RepID=A0A495W4F0_9PSEU|nr:NAD(P)-binding domain-containing protein [Saccharothrix australiensis]RKT54678.1 3-hydroxyisobutyrate dehydrogenase-like beta-hydroxyacid dehydrogenase [Saccharothrix australiensis]
MTDTTNTTSHREPVTVLGLGLMGRALAAAFLEAGHPTTVWNRTPDKATDLVAGGAVLAPSAADAIRAASLVVVCLSDTAAVRDALAPHRADLAGRTLVNLTSGTSDEARELATWSDDHLDGAIMAIPESIGRPEAFLLFSGSRAAFDRHRDSLGRLGNATFFGEDPGLASLYDVALLGVMWGTLNAFLHGAALLGAAKVDATAFAPFANQWIGSVTGFVDAYAAQIDRGDYQAEDAALETHLATMKYLVRESAAAGVDTDWPARLQALTERAIDAGHAGASYASLVEVFRGRA